MALFTILYWSQITGGTAMADPVTLEVFTDYV
jgi:hypothetical protein